MDYIKIRFGGILDEIESEIGKTIDGMFRPRALSPTFNCSECTWKPQMDIYETPDAIIILAEIAGVNKEDLDVELNSRAVKISGRRMGKAPGTNSTYRLAEIQYGSFERILYLPVPIDPENVGAIYSNGFLEIRLTRLPLDKTHKVPILDG
ncbi:MAG: Hsp20/alpha crystallin family protein [Desulfobacterales bacterium]|nr:Hsp20/alpha crystallin family protein [Desulfobacterales bacterium]